MIPIRQSAFLVDDRPLAVGEVFTIAHHFERRTFWEWLTRRPRRLREYVIVADASAR